jgi:hypothetical protein
VEISNVKTAPSAIAKPRFTSTAPLVSSAP